MPGIMSALAFDRLNRGIRDDRTPSLTGVSSLMPRVCTVCAHPDHERIDASLVSGEPNRRIAAQHGLTEQALRRHRADHVPAAMALAAEAAEMAHADDLLGQVRRLQARVLTILDRTESTGDLRTALGAIREARGNVELLAKLLGHLNDAPQVNVMVSPEWLSVRAVILAALATFPEARAAVAERLLAIEAGT